MAKKSVHSNNISISYEIVFYKLSNEPAEKKGSDMESQKSYEERCIHGGTSSWTYTCLMLGSLNANKEPTFTNESLTTSVIIQTAKIIFDNHVVNIDKIHLH